MAHICSRIVKTHTGFLPKSTKADVVCADRKDFPRFLFCRDFLGFGDTSPVPEWQISVVTWGAEKPAGPPALLMH